MDRYLNFKKIYLTVLFGFSLLCLTIAFSSSAHAAVVITTPRASVYVPVGGTVYHGYGYRHGYYYGRGGAYHGGTVYRNGNVYHRGGYRR